MVIEWLCGEDWFKRILATGLTVWLFWAVQAAQCEMFEESFENLFEKNFVESEGSFDKNCSRLAAVDCFDLIDAQHCVKTELVDFLKRFA